MRNEKNSLTQDGIYLIVTFCKEYLCAILLCDLLIVSDLKHVPTIANL